MLLRSYEFPSAAICGSVMSVYEMGHKNSSGALGPADDEAAVGCRIAAAFAMGSRATRQPAARDAASAALDCGWSWSSAYRSTPNVELSAMDEAERQSCWSSLPDSLKS